MNVINNSTKATLFFVAGIVSAIVGVIILLNNISFFMRAEKTTGTVIRIEKLVENEDGSTVTRYNIHVRYFVDGVEYNEVVNNGLPINMKEGGEVTIYYSPYNPQKIRFKLNNFLGAFIVIVLGASCLVFSGRVDLPRLDAS